MNKRQRIQAVLSHRPTDRIPRYDIFLPGYRERWRTHHGLPEDADIHRFYANVDIQMVPAMQEGPLSSRVGQTDIDADTYHFRDSWGRHQKCSRSGTFFEVLETALPEKSLLDQLTFEDPWAVDGRVRQFQDAVAYAIEHDRSCPVTGVMGLFMASYYLRGEFELLTDLADDPPFGRALADRLADFLTAAAIKALDVTGTWDTALWIYDELGNNKSSVISPGTFERVYLDAYRRMIGTLKAHGLQNIILHCDGNCLDLLDLLIDAGFTGLQGINPSAGMTVPAVKARCGNRLALIGGMCNIHVLTRGSHRQIEEQTKSILDAARDGGVVIGTHSIDSDVPVENYEFYNSLLGEESWVI